MDKPTDTITRACSAAELGLMVALFRDYHGWSQETLADLSGQNTRTIQRVEAGESSNEDTRRALARAFGMDDINAFNQVLEFPTPEAAVKAKAQFDAKYVALEVRRVTGRELVSSIVRSGPFRAIHTGAIGTEPREVEDLYASVMDYIQDVMHVADEIGHAEALRYGDEVELMIANMRTHGFEIGLGVRDILVRPGAHRTAMSYIVALPAGTGARTIAVTKEMQSAF
jgi:transcriptional regulator with XRE-family HTH domain